MDLIYETDRGRLYHADCIDLLSSLPDRSVDMFFADPPFNLKKQYGKNFSDDLEAPKYLAWTREWVREAVRVVVPGGALFIYNLPKWLIHVGAFLNSFEAVRFKHWVAIDKAHSLPIPNRLSPSHYGMLYYVKGEKPRVFNRDDVRIPIAVCRHCGKDIKDYGGHKKFLNPKGINLSDVWDDIPPVRHRKYKNRPANELAPVILERVIRLTTNVGDLIVDPFSGGGSSAYVAQKLGRRWIVGDINDCVAARERLIDLGNGVHPEWATSKRHFCEPAPVWPSGTLFT